MQKPCEIIVHKNPEGTVSNLLEIRGFYAGKNPRIATVVNVSFPTQSLFVPFHFARHGGVQDGVTPRDLVRLLQVRFKCLQEDLSRMALAGGLPSVTDKPDAYRNALNLVQTQLSNLDQSLKYLEGLSKQHEVN